ncbi:hypothetical protein KAZ82_01025 [Candidatus Babeliales bacterium]|nr:hypothetical protein [Candidatus Babeliales bacterium]
MKNLYLIVMILGLHHDFFGQLIDQMSDDLQPYVNRILSVHEIMGNTNYTLHLSFERNNPVAVYAPQSFQESQDKQIHRFILPNTQMGCDFDCECLQVGSNDVEIVLQGVMLLNVIGQDFLLMTVNQEEKKI